MITGRLRTLLVVKLVKLRNGLRMIVAFCRGAGYQGRER